MPTGDAARITGQSGNTFSINLPLNSGLRLDTGPDVYASEDRKEGARAFLEKRDPVWEGR